MITILSKPSFFILLLFTVLYFGCQSSSASSKGYQDLEVGEFAEQMSEEGVILLDVRTPEETAEGMIEGAQEIDFRADDFQDKIAELDKDAKYLVYCRSGARSASACGIMKDLGFSDVSNLVGGYLAWKAEHE